MKNLPKQICSEARLTKIFPLTKSLYIHIEKIELNNLLLLHCFDLKFLSCIPILIVTTYAFKIF